MLGNGCGIVVVRVEGNVDSPRADTHERFVRNQIGRSAVMRVEVTAMRKNFKINNKSLRLENNRKWK